MDSRVLIYAFVAVVAALFLLLVLSIFYQCVMLTKDPRRLSKENTSHSSQDNSELIHASLDSLFHLQNLFTAKCDDLTFV